MPIKINVPFSQKEEAKKLGAVWVPDVKTWVIPDSIENINPFKPWLPGKDGFIVKYPYFVAKSKRDCWKCHKETPLIALGARRYFSTLDHPVKDLIWSKCETPALFSSIRFIDEDLAIVLRKLFPFFQKKYSKTLKMEAWLNTCINCQTIQGDNYNFDNPSSPFYFRNGNLHDIETEQIQLRFDYYLDSSIDEGEYYWINGILS